MSFVLGCAWSERVAYEVKRAHLIVSEGVTAKIASIIPAPKPAVQRHEAACSLDPGSKYLGDFEGR